MTYGCHDRAPLKAHRGRDGYWCDGQTLTIKAVTIPQVMTKDCQYTKSVLGQQDAGCNGCKHRDHGSAAITSAIADAYQQIFHTVITDLAKKLTERKA